MYRCLLSCKWVSYPGALAVKTYTLVYFSSKASLLLIKSYDKNQSIDLIGLAHVEKAYSRNRLFLGHNRPYWRELRPLVNPWAWCIKEGTDPWKGQKRALLSHVQVSLLTLSLSSPSLSLLCFYDAFVIIIISDPRRGCFMGFHEFIFFSFFFFFLFFFFHRDIVRAISLEPSLVETPDSVCCLVLQSNFALLLTIQFASLFFNFLIFLFFSAKILSGPYIWNRYSQRLQIECAAWSCGLILHYCLLSNSLCYFFFSARFCHNFVRAISLEQLLTETPN